MGKKLHGICTPRSSLYYRSMKSGTVKDTADKLIKGIQRKDRAAQIDM